MPGRILVDLLGYTGGRGGTETYVREVLPRLATELPGTSFIALTGREGRDRVRSFFPGAVISIGWVGRDRATWAAGEIVAVDSAARRVDADLIWCPANFGPITRGRVPRVVTVHDVIYHEFPGSGREAWTRRITAALMERTARTARALITVSASAADAITTHLGIPRDRITVVHNGSAAVGRSEDASESLAALHIPSGRPILLSTGNRMPHKNFRGLLEALRVLAPDQRPLAVIPGGGKPDPLRDVVRELELESDVILPGWITDAQLAALYETASVYVCPSLTEGFGLPVVDAMRHGRLVVANDVPVLREVGGAFALYGDARNPQAFSRVISEALTMDGAGADSRRRGGCQWAAQFTWEATASGTARALAAASESGSANG
jgi:glycosyltransferase involved in cell wall biosynthesis